MPGPELLVFDLDGTLIDSSTDLCRSVNAMLLAFGRPELPFPVIASYIGEGAVTLVGRALEATDASREPAQLSSSSSSAELQEAYAYFIWFYREHKLDNTRLYNGVAEALADIRKASPDVLMAVLTNKPVNPSREICQALGVAKFFFQNYGGDSFRTKKPDPEGLLKLIEEANGVRQTRARRPLLLSEVVMIGDSAVDIGTARRAGVRSLGCTFGLAPESLQASEPDLLVQHASEWPVALGFTSQASAS